MSDSTLTQSLPHIPPDVAEFASRQGVTPYLPAVLGLARRIFPEAPLSVYLEEDHVTPADRYIVIEADLNGTDSSQVADAYMRWAKELFQHCPATHVRNFRLGVV